MKNIITKIFKNKLKISILVENGVCDVDLKGEWGLSMFIEFNGKKNLWDTGLTDIFLENAKQMKINLDKTDLIILSHFHNDHTGGLKNTNFADNKEILAHSRVFKEVGNAIKGNYKKIESDGVYEIAKDFYFLGEIERTSFEKGVYGKDKMLDDTALVAKTDLGLVVIAGCSHSGIVNICEYAKKVTGENKIYGLIGGFHLLKMVGNDSSSDEDIENSLEYFEKEKIEKLYPIHCVDFEVLAEMKQRFNIKKFYTGDIVEF